MLVTTKGERKVVDITLTAKQQEELDEIEKSLNIPESIKKLKIRC
jgi:hypothetical protein